MTMYFKFKLITSSIGKKIITQIQHAITFLNFGEHNFLSHPLQIS